MSSSRPAERRQLTVMLCDLVAWTALSLQLDPEELAEVIEVYRKRCRDVISSYGGTVAQYVGDGVLAYFGYPRAHEDDAERAIRAAIGIAGTPRWAHETANLSVHVGIATGVVVVGNLPGGREEISAIGSALNLAARLQGLAGPGMVVVSEQTRRLSRGLFEYRDLGRHDLKGFNIVVPAWAVLGERRVRSRFHALRASAALTPLVDRSSECDELRNLWESARGGHGRVLLLAAEPGVGKSRLAEVVARRIVDRRSLRLWYYCSPNLQSTPLAPLVSQLALAAGFTDRDDDDTKLSKLVALVPTEQREIDWIPLLANLLSLKYESRYPLLNVSPQRQKHRLFEVLMRLLEALASRRPVLLIVEDLHWIDPSSDELIGLLIDRVKELPVLAILTARPEFQSHWDDRPHVLKMPLTPLDRRDSIVMVELLCRGRSMPATTISQIAEKTDGLPLFIEDVTRDVLEAADLKETERGSATGYGDSPLPIPATLNDSLMSRLDRLGSAKDVAQIGAVIGREFSYDLLAKVADMPEEHLREEIYRLVDAGLLVSSRSTAVLSYGFKHALVRDAAYSSLLRKEQVALHARIARVLVESFPEISESRPDVLAHHYRAANDIVNSVKMLVKAAKLSALRSGFVEAIQQLESALTILAEQPKSRERMRLELRVHCALGGINAEYRGFSSAECGSTYTTALELCRELGDTPEIFSVLSGVGSFEITRARFAKCRALAEECLARAAAQQTRPPHIMGHLLLGGTLFLTGELAPARDHLDRALRLYEQEQLSQRGKQVLYVQDQRTTGLCYLALTLTIMGYVDSGLRAAENALAHSQSLGGPHTINYSLCYLAAVHHIRGAPRAALESATQSLKVAREQGFATWIGISQMIRGASLVRNGHGEEGLAEIIHGMEAHTDMEAKAYQPYGLSLFAEGLIAAGRLDEALEALARALAIAERTGERFYAPELLRLQAHALAGKHDVAEAERCLRGAIELSTRQEARLFALRSAASLCGVVDSSRRPALVRDVLEPVYGWFTEGDAAPDLHDARELLTGAAEI